MTAQYETPYEAYTRLPADVTQQEMHESVLQHRAWPELNGRIRYSHGAVCTELALQTSSHTLAQTLLEEADQQYTLMLKEDAEDFGRRPMFRRAQMMQLFLPRYQRHVSGKPPSVEDEQALWGGLVEMLATEDPEGLNVIHESNAVVTTELVAHALVARRNARQQAVVERSWMAHPRQMLRRRGDNRRQEWTFGLTEGGDYTNMRRYILRERLGRTYTDVFRWSFDACPAGFSDAIGGDTVDEMVTKLVEERSKSMHPRHPSKLTRFLDQRTEIFGRNMLDLIANRGES